MQPTTNPFTNELIDIEWNNDHQLRLNKYINQFNPKLTYYNVYDRINWKELLEVTGFNNEELIKIKVDEIYDDNLDPFRGTDEYNFEKLYNNVNVIGNPFIPEVQSLLENIQLEPFLDDLEQPSKREEVGLSKDKLNRSENPSQNLKISGIEADKDSSKTYNSNMIKNTEYQLEKHSSKNPQGMKIPASFIPVKSGYKFDTNINRPSAICSTNNVNVVTKSEMKSIIISKETPLKEKRKSVSEKIKSSLFKSSSKKPPKEQSHLEQSHEIITLKPDSISNKNTKNSRRRSMVVQSLPLYIKEQLRNENPRESVDQSFNEIPTRKEKQGTLKLNKDIFKTPHQPGSPVAKKSSRLQNILTNSQSMYAYSKDISSVKSNSSQTPTTSGYTSDRILEENSNKDDKVYISPNSITKAYERYQDYNDDSVIKGFQNDEIDFINLDDSLDDPIENNDNEDEDEDEDNKYLFRF